MKKAEEILREYIEFDDVNGSETVELLPLTIIDIMEEYASQFRKHDVSGRSEQFVCECQRHNPYTGIKFDFALRCFDCNKIIQQNNCR